MFKTSKIFLNRMLCIIRQNTDNRYTALDTSFIVDLNWFHTLLAQHNGVIAFDDSPVDAQIQLDSSLTGFGACFNKMVYALPLPHTFQKFHITQLEMLK